MNIFENDSSIISSENNVVANGHGVLIYILLGKFQKIVSTFSYNFEKVLTENGTFRRRTMLIIAFYLLIEYV